MMKSAAEIYKWAETAQVGDRMVYHRGVHLMSLGGEKTEGASAALIVYQRGGFLMYQRRHEDMFDYTLEKLSAPTSKLMVSP